jgi:hypothetical protein
MQIWHRQEEGEESQESRTSRLGSGFDLCLCPSRRSFHVDPAPYNGHVHTTHCIGNMHRPHHVVGIGAREDTPCAGGSSAIIARCYCGIF